MSKKTRNSSGAGRQTAQPADKASSHCNACKAPLPSGAVYCPGCGAPQAGAAARRPLDRVSLVFYSIIAVSAVATVGGLIWSASQNSVAPPPMAGAPSAGQGGQAPGVDISALSPREAADRLFNRIMVASERGDRDEVLRFLPMALQAYDMVPDLDADAHYHIGLMHAAAGDYASARAQSAILRQYAPKHLLAMLLDYDDAVQAGDAAGAARIEAEFADAYFSEMSSARPEYDAHRNSIDGFRGRIANPGG